MFVFGKPDTIVNSIPVLSSHTTSGCPRTRLADLDGWHASC